MKCLIIAIFTHLLATVYSETPDRNVAAKYDAAELLRKIFNTNDTILPRANYGLIQFEGQTSQLDFVNFETQNNLEDNRENSYTNEASVKYENEYEPTYNTNVQNVVKFEHNNKDGSKKKKRRKRKPKQHYGQLGNGQNLPHAPGYYGNGPGPYPPYGGQYKPPRPRPRPSLASEALSAVTEALTSIALYDDYQCVPRLLCEAAAGGALGSSGILQTVSGLQPLLTLLSAYSGLTSNPLFVFGRAVLLGAASKSNPATCRYAYTACPTDPELLVHYLNNHNGGFFRFFNAPQQGQQNLEQFYNQLSQNYGLNQPDQEYNQQNYGFNNNQQNYGFDNNQQHYGFNNNQQNYGSHNPNLYSNYNQNYGLAYPYQNNGQSIRFKNNDNFNENTNRIEKRIQIKPNALYVDNLEDENPRWSFPEGNRNPVNYVNNDAINFYSSNDDNFNNNNKRIKFNDQNDRDRNHKDNRKGKVLNFPGVNNEEDYLEANHDKNRGSFFPEHEDNKQYFDHNAPTKNNNYDNKYYDNRQYLDYNTPTKNTNYYNTSNNNFANKYVNRDEFYANRYYANKNKYDNNNYANPNQYYNNDNYGNNNKYNNNDDVQGVRTVYVVRGNGDPNNPEIHKLRPGQAVH
ncbi:probable cyclin-dependent serine/threonine-protein kinase DDB_G0292550 [Maniola hyperantus]|uniref:probable cyclin-dependent serine/threonine-protein kinase DDB_G0292550 n=1 Tax=Aphantopus hyperantus TaxID=2795564 RepID=UPI00374A29AD